MICFLSAAGLRLIKEKKTVTFFLTFGNKNNAPSPGILRTKPG